MSKITRDRLARGTKLVPEHTHGTTSGGNKGLEGAAFLMERAGIEAVQMQKPSGTFRISLHIPHIASDFCYPNASDDNAQLGIAFTLPPAQQFFNTATDGQGQVRPDFAEATPQMRLVDFGISFDVRSEGAAIVDQFHNEGGGSAVTTSDSADQGKLAYDRIDAYDDLQISLLEKQPQFWTGTDNIEPEQEVFSATLSSEGVISGLGNPYLAENLNKKLHPGRTYVVVIRAPGLLDLTAGAPYDTHAIVSAMVTMKVATTLVNRDVNTGGAATTVQNIPSGSDGLRTFPTVTITSPSPGDPIEADTAAGFSTNYATIDEVFRQKLRGGWDANSEVPIDEPVGNDACLDVIAVPLFGNRMHGGVRAKEVLDEPYMALNTDPLVDRRFIPILQSWVLHHAFICYNWQAWDPPATLELARYVASSATMNFTVEVGMATGLRSDNFDYHQLAALSIANPLSAATWDTHLIDRIKTRPYSPGDAVNFPLRTDGVNTLAPWDLELHNIPLIGAGGAGYFSQGEPIYLGRSWSATQARRTTDTGAAATDGGEQWIEVRAYYDDPNGLDDTGAGGAMDDEDILAGYGGHWVFLVGKKTTQTIDWVRR